MLKRLADNQNGQSLAVNFRKRRFAFFLSLLSQLEKPIQILDVGGTENYWKMMGANSINDVNIILLNLAGEPVTLPNVNSVAGDARILQFNDRSFDIVFSNSVIEHVGAHDDQLQMANEVQRVGKRFFIQTPNRHFPLEPHFLFPFFQFLPKAIQIKLLQNFNLGWFPKTSDPKKAAEIVDGITLLGKTEFQSLFPKAIIYEEKVFGMTKSFVAYGGW